MVAASAASGATRRGLKLLPEIYPLVTIMGIGLTGVVAFMGYALTKTDVIINRSNEIPPWERLDLENPRAAKLLVFNQKYDFTPELRKLKTELKETKQ